MTFINNNMEVQCDGCLSTMGAEDVEGWVSYGTFGGERQHYHGTCWQTGWYTGIEPKGEWAVTEEPEPAFDHVKDEVRTVSRTGGEKGVKPARFDLVPVGPLTTVAKLYGKGAEKYTKYGECTCAVVESLSRREGSAGPAMTAGSKPTTRTTPPDSSQTQSSGTPRIQIESDSTPRRTETEPEAERTGSTASPARSTTPTWPSPAASAERPQSTSTTTTAAAPEGAAAGIAFGGRSATAATSDSATSKVGSQSTGRQHLPGCPALTVIHSGDHNWMRGYEWSKSYAALMRHVTQFWGGEDLDPDTQLPHLASVVFHAFALMHYMDEHRSFDDRPRVANDDSIK